MNNDSFTNSYAIASTFGVAHNEMLRKIRKLNEYGGIGALSHRESRGRLFDVYNLSLNDALKVVSSMSSNKATIEFNGYFFDLICSGNSAEYSYGEAIKATEGVKKDKKQVVTYIVKNIVNNHYKIGRTSQQPERRVAALQVSSPDALELQAYIVGDYENQLHKEFSCVRLSSEWFKLDDEDLYDISNRHKARFFYVDTFMGSMFELWHEDDSGMPEPSITDFFTGSPTAKALNVAKQSLRRHMATGAHYKEIFTLVKFDLIALSTTLMIEEKQ